MAAWLIAAIERLPPACASCWSSLRRRVLLLAGAITSLTLEAGRGGGWSAGVTVPSRTVAPTPPRGRCRRACARRCRRPSCASPASSLRGSSRSYLQFAYGRASAGSVKAVTPGLRSQLIAQRAQVTPAERAPPPAGRFAGHGRNDARVRRRDGDRSRTEGSRRIGCGLRFGNRPAAGW